MNKWLKNDENLLSLVAHEVRGPLATIMNASSLLQSSSLESSEHRRFVEMIKRQAGQLFLLMESITTLTRINNGKDEIYLEAVPVHRLVDEALEACQFILQRKRIAVEIEQLDRGLHVNGSSCLLCQVLVNLLHNAVKYSPQGSQIRLSVSETSSQCRISVKDEGVGMRPDQVRGIFEAYSQLGQSRVGLGLGLFISAQFVEMHGGRIEATSEGIGEGSEFTVYLPVS